MRIEEISVRRSRSSSAGSFRDTIPILRSDIRVSLRRNVVWSDDLYEYFFQVWFAVGRSQLLDRSFGQQLSVLDDPNDVAELFDFAHDVRRENHSLAQIAAVADEGGNRSRRHDVKTKRGLVENHHRG